MANDDAIRVQFDYIVFRNNTLDEHHLVDYFVNYYSLLLLLSSLSLFAVVVVVHVYVFPMSPARI